ncbi:hypothetical protein [Herbidospora cretacea]|uniref:hypothetical protein n=1 Tax=Herbidospora cretacea TaxID=28444 RepID=UPI0007734761|nr:hypothetical protein [Herbidospora cretacea]
MDHGLAGTPARRGFRRRVRRIRARSRREEGIRLHPATLRSISLRGLAIRFAVGAAILVVAGLVGNRWGAVAGGLFLAFPALLAAALTRVKGWKPTIRDAKGLVLGAACLIGFAGCVWGLAVTLPAWLALVIAIMVWTVMADVLYLNPGRRA